MSDYNFTVAHAHAGFDQTNNNNSNSSNNSGTTAGTPLLAPTTSNASSSNNGSSANAVVSGSVNLLDWDDDSHLHHTHTTNTNANNQSHSSPQQLLLQDFVPNYMSPPLFQQHWMGWSTDAFAGRLCQLQRLPSSTQEVEHVLRAVRVFVMASGALPNNGGFKFFVYSNLATSELLLGQLLVVHHSHQSSEVTMTVKCDNAQQAKVAQWLDVIVTALAPVFLATP